MENAAPNPGKLTEESLIRKLRSRFASSRLPVGIGDDAAAFDMPEGYMALACSDMLVEGTHFLRNLHPADSTGFRAVAVNVSDIGAMGGTPMIFLVSLAVPEDLSASWIDAFYDGVYRAQQKFDVQLAGGDTSRANIVVVDVAMFGRVEPSSIVQRSGAKPGDKVYVTGTLGGSALGLQRLRAGDTHHPASHKHLYPEPRHFAGRTVARRATAMIDVSDGLSTDLLHICRESNVEAVVDRERIPVAPGATLEDALHGGEEYELLITGNGIPSLIQGLPVHEIGQIRRVRSEPQVLLRSGAVEEPLPAGGWQHF